MYIESVHVYTVQIEHWNLSTGAPVEIEGRAEGERGRISYLGYVTGLPRIQELSVVNFNT